MPVESGFASLGVVQPATRTVEVWRPVAGMRIVRDDATIDGEDIVPGFWLTVAVLLAE